jgi:hypothetical protein
MQRIATDTRQRDKFGPGKDGFTAGNIATGLSSTQLEPDWFDNLQEEVSNVVEIELGPLDGADKFQLWKAIDAQIGRSISGIPPLPGFVLRAGDTMTGPLSFNAGLAPPTTGSIGSRLVLFPGSGAPGSADLALGIMPGGMWFSARTVADTFSWYGGEAVIATLGGNGTLSLVGTAVLGRDPLAPAEAATKRYVDDRVDVSGYLPLTGGTITGGLTVNGQFAAMSGVQITGAGVLYANYGGNWIGFGWDGTNLNAYIDNGYVGRAVIANPGAVIGGNLEVGGNGNFGSAGIYGGLIVVGSINCADVGATGVINCSHVQLNNFDLILNQPGEAGCISRAGYSKIVLQSTGGAPLAEVSISAQDFNFTGAWAGRFSNPNWDTISDVQLKKDIEPYRQGLAAIRGLAPVSYAFNGLGGTTDDGRRFVGFLANDCIQIMPELAVGERRVKLYADDAEDTPVQGLNLSPVTFALVNAIKELAERIEALEDDRVGPPTPRV